MQTEASRQFVLEFFRELAAGNAACWNRVADDATWKLIARASDYPYPSEYTKASYRQLVQDAAGEFPDGLHFTITGTTAEGERVALEVRHGRADPRGHRLTRVGQRQPERPPVGGIEFAGQVAAVFQPVQDPGQGGGPGAGLGTELADVERPPVGEVGQRVDLGRGEVQVSQRAVQRVQGVVRGPLQRKYDSG